jgi:hypothetical protein
MSAQDEPERLNDIPSQPSGSLQRFEAELASLSPGRLQLDRDRLMFLAGQVSVSPALVLPGRHRWLWPTAFSAMTALAASLMLIIVLRPEPPVLERIVYLPGPTPQVDLPSDNRAETLEPSPVDALASNARHDESLSHRPSDSIYLRQRDQVLAMGIEGWANDVGSSGSRERVSAPTYGDLLKGLLHDG